MGVGWDGAQGPHRWGGGGTGGGATSFLGKGGSAKGIKAVRAGAQAGFRAVLGRSPFPESRKAARHLF